MLSSTQPPAPVQWEEMSNGLPSTG